jgi:hypothetical protein
MTEPTEKVPEAPPPQFLRLISRPMLVIFLLIGFGLTAIALWRIGQALASQAWPTAEGRIAGMGASAKSASIVVAYQVAGESYEISLESTAITGRALSPEGEWRWMLAHYKTGQQVAVAFDPDDPSNAILEPGLTPHAAVPLVGGLALVLAGGFGFWRRRGY